MVKEFPLLSIPRTRLLSHSVLLHIFPYFFLLDGLNPSCLLGGLMIIEMHLMSCHDCSSARLGISVSQKEIR